MRSWGCEVDYSAWPEALRPDVDMQRADCLEDCPEQAQPRLYPRGYWDTLIQAETRLRLPSDIVDINRMAKGASWNRHPVRQAEWDR